MNLIINLQIIDCSKRHGSLLALSRLFLSFFVQYFKQGIYLNVALRKNMIGPPPPSPPPSEGEGKGEGGLHRR